MKKHYITSDKIGEFIETMYRNGIKVDTDPANEELIVHLPSGGYEWIKVFHKGSFDNLCAAFIPPTDEPKSLG